MGKFHITTTERSDESGDRATGCATEGPSRSLACQGGACQTFPPDTPGYGADSSDISPFTGAEAQE